MRNKIAIGSSVAILVIGALSLYEEWGRAHSVLIGVGLSLFIINRWVSDRKQPVRGIESLAAVVCLAGIVLFFTKN